ncbi:MAG: hypothetical protein LBC99_08825 [Spirochaetota bacterium]|jgi:hypothetical protein|nr:hypothetical protein [Spirochaetota bacterium]
MHSDTANGRRLNSCLALALTALLILQAGFLYAEPGSDGLKTELALRLRQQYADPFLAGFLSGMYWGLGQFYAKDYAKGSLFVFGDLVFKGLALGLAIKLKNKYISASSDSGMSWRDMSGTDKGLVIGAAAVWLGVTVLSIADAGETARKYNARADALFHLDIGMTDSREGGGALCLGWNIRF